jgi:hypothetical protein
MVKDDADNDEKLSLNMSRIINLNDSFTKGVHGGLNAIFVDVPAYLCDLIIRSDECKARMFEKRRK